MGLSISRSIVEAHHGQIHAVRNADVGSTFSFSLPTGDRRDSPASHEGLSAEAGVVGSAPRREAGAR
jgi:hypothetical protein